MSFSEFTWRARETVVFGFREYAAQNPPRVTLSTALPRSVLQCLFFALLGRVVAGEAGEEHAFVGALAAILTLSTTVALADVPVLDKRAGTFHRIRTGRIGPATVLALRCLPHAVHGFASVVAALLIVAPLIGRAGMIPELARLLPLYLLMTFSTAAAGLAGAALAVGRRADVLVGNLLAYLVLLAGGVFLPQGRVDWVDRLGTVLPVRHGLQAVRGAMDGTGWLPGTLGEVAVGAAWAALAWLIIGVQARRAWRHGIDGYA